MVECLAAAILAACAAGCDAPPRIGADAEALPVDGPRRAVPSMRVATVSEDGEALIVLAPATAIDRAVWWPETPIGAQANGAPIDVSPRLFVESADVRTDDEGWTPPAGDWRVVDLEDADSDAEALAAARSARRALWVAAVSLEPESLPTDIEVAGRTIRVLPREPDAPMARSARSPVEGARSPLRRAWEDPGARRRFGNALRTGHGTDASVPTEAGARSAREPREVSLLADQTSSLWRAALRTIGAHDERLADAVTHRLTAASFRPDGPHRPLWAPESVITRRLLENVLLHANDAPRVIDEASTFLSATPAQIAWVVDDADDAGARIAITDVSGEARDAAVSAGDLAAAPIVDLGRFETVEVVVEGQGPWRVITDEGSSDVGRVGPFVMGAQSPTVRVLARPATLATWRAGVAVAAPADLTPAWRLVPPGNGVGWSMVVELPPSLVQERGEVTLHFATVEDERRGVAPPPFRVTSGGRVFRGEAAAGLTRGRTQHEGSVVLLFELPLDALDDTGAALRLAMSVSTASGDEVGTWPRPRMPDGVPLSRALIGLERATHRGAFD